jgi:hypothetical protein
MAASNLTRPPSGPPSGWWSIAGSAAGVANLNATVLVDAGNTSLTRSFSIPLIAAP